MKKIKENRGASYAVITVAYIVASVIGIASYKMLEANLAWWLALLVSDAIATVAVFIFSLVFGNASVYDPYWSVQPIVILGAFAVGKDITPLRCLLLIAVFFWGIRLTLNWAYTFPNLYHQDWRYTMLKEKTGVFYPLINLLGIHMFPTVVVWACVLPAVYAFLNDVPLNYGSVIFFCLSVFAAVLQGTADFQMHKYRKNRNGRFIRVGLWKHSRHPNYLGEILMWWGVALSVICAAPQVWYLAAGALVNMLMFFFVSVPLADGRQSGKPGFAEYKKETRAFLPVKKFR